MSNLLAWLQSLSEDCRDDIPAGAMADWADMMQRWRLSDSEWAELKRRVTRGHRGGPVRFFELEEHYIDILDECARRRNAEHLREITGGA